MLMLVKGCLVQHHTRPVGCTVSMAGGAFSLFQVNEWFANCHFKVENLHCAALRVINAAAKRDNHVWITVRHSFLLLEIMQPCLLLKHSITKKRLARMLLTWVVAIQRPSQCVWQHFKMSDYRKKTFNTKVFFFPSSFCFGGKKQQQISDTWGRKNNRFGIFFLFVTSQYLKYSLNSWLGKRV